MLGFIDAGFPTAAQSRRAFGAETPRCRCPRSESSSEAREAHDGLAQAACIHRLAEVLASYRRAVLRAGRAACLDLLQPWVVAQEARSENGCDET